MQIKYVTQKSTKEKGFWQPTLILNADGSVTLQATTYYFRDLELAIPQTTWVPAEGDKVYVENDLDPLYRVPTDSATPYKPLSGEVESSPGPIIWVENGIVYVLTHEGELL